MTVQVRELLFREDLFTYDTEISVPLYEITESERTVYGIPIGIILTSASRISEYAVTTNMMLKEPSGFLSRNRSRINSIYAARPVSSPRMHVRKEY